MITTEQQKIILDHVKALHPLKVGIFGSYARDENKAGSDLDILLYLDYSYRISLLDLIGVEQDLSDALGLKVDLLTSKSISRYILPYVEKDVRFIRE